MKAAWIVQTSHRKADQLRIAVRAFSACETRSTYFTEPSLMSSPRSTRCAIVFRFSLGKSKRGRWHQDSADMWAATQALTVTTMALQRSDGRCIALISNCAANTPSRDRNRHIQDRFRIMSTAPHRLASHVPLRRDEYYQTCRFELQTAARHRDDR